MSAIHTVLAEVGGKTFDVEIQVAAQRAGEVLRGFDSPGFDFRDTTKRELITALAELGSVGKFLNETKAESVRTALLESVKFAHDALVAYVLTEDASATLSRARIGIPNGLEMGQLSANLSTANHALKEVVIIALKNFCTQTVTKGELIG